MIDYEIIRYTSAGVPIDNFTLSEISTFSLAYGDMTVEALVLQMPRAGRSPNDFEKDQILEVYRIVNGVKYLEGERAWFIRRRDFFENEQGLESILLTCYDANYLLDSRIIAYYANSAYADKADYSDDMLKALVYENVGAGCVVYNSVSDIDTSRILSGLTVQGDFSLAPSITKQFAWEKLKPNLDEICGQSREAGTYLTYDMVRTGRATFEFRTYTGQRGNDYTGTNRKVVSKDFGNLINPVLTFDDENERNYGYVTGTGIEAARTIEIVSDTDRINASPWNRRELQVYAAYLSADSTSAHLAAQGNAALYEFRPKIQLTGEISETENFRYGIDFGFGDKLIGTYLGYTLDVHLDKIMITVNPSGEQFETLALRIRGES